MKVASASTPAQIARQGLKSSESALLSRAERIEARSSHLQNILDTVSIYDEPKTERQVAAAVLRATCAAQTEKGKSWVSYLGLKHLAAGLQGPTGMALSAIGADMMRGGPLMISDEDAVTTAAALMDGIAAHTPGILESTAVKTTSEVALRLRDMDAAKNVLWNFFEDHDGRQSPGGGCG